MTPKSGRIVETLERTARGILAEVGVTTHGDLRTRLAARSGELGSLVNLAVRRACESGRIMLLLQGQQPERDLVTLPRTFRKETSLRPAEGARASTHNERALHRGMAKLDWPAVAAALDKQARMLGVTIPSGAAGTAWTPVRWYSEEPERGQWTCKTPLRTVELRAEWVDAEDALAKLRSQRAYDRNDPVVMVPRAVGPWPCDDLGEQLADAIDQVNFLHRVRGGWTWFRAATVVTATAGAVALRTTRWSLTRAGLYSWAVAPGCNGRSVNQAACRGTQPIKDDRKRRSLPSSTPRGTETEKRMTPEERAAGAHAVRDAVEAASETIKREIERARTVLEPGASHGVLLELLRAAPECIEELERAPAVLTGYAAILAIEMRPEAAAGLQERVYELLNSDEGRTTANHVRQIVRLLLEAYDDEPEAATPVQ